MSRLSRTLRLQLINSPVGDEVGERVYPVRLPQGATIPAVVYQRISTDPVRSHSGNSGLATVRFQLSCWAETYDEASTIAEKIRTALHGKRDLGPASAVVNDLEGFEEDLGLWYRYVDVQLRGDDG